ncbi:cytochrome c biogenesis protein CcdA [Acidaminococcus timonensis]|uniref:cytochrome c biogenesis CcdA family protein n=1 Tax=Acidaminococcus timonensis TaxID=1871002 RepID=UPI002941C4EC|nr:cytochrome c biogenesis protein CcdA [Acidaminococcus timonensis]
MDSLTLGAAFAGGLLSFASPCVLPLLPTFLLLLAGSSPSRPGKGRGTLLVNTLAFLAGFTVVFLAMGATATALGRLVLAYWSVLEKVAGVVLMVLGLFLSGLWTPLFLLQDRRPFLQKRRQGTWGCFLLGASFTLGWTPCTGPILTAILMAAGSQKTVEQGVVLLLAYALGFAVPFLAAALFWQRLCPTLHKGYSWLPWIQKAAGVFLLLFGIMMVSGQTMRLMGMLNGL